MRQQYLLFLLILLSEMGNAQMLTGTVMDAKSDLPLAGTTIFNRSQKIFKKASFEGKFSIIATEGDVIIFSSVGYRSDTIELSEELLKGGLDIGLMALPVSLDTVTVDSRSYVDDSLRRREEYKYFYDMPIRNITGGNTPQHGFGISFSPFTFFSPKERAKRRLRKQLEYNEEQAYIDHYFSSSYVQRVTGLHGEELRKFMLMYRPTYSFVRKANKEDLLRYVDESLKKFKLRK